MRNLLLLLLQYKVTLLWVLLSGVSIIVATQYNRNNQERMHSYTMVANSYVEKYRAKLMKRYYTRQENEVLRAENARLRQDIIHKNLKIKQLSFPKLADSLYTDSNWSYIPGRVVNNSIYKMYNFMSINVGSADGVAKGDGVMTAQGVVGVVIAVGKHYCVASSLLNKNTKIRGKTDAENAVGIIEWEGKDTRFAKLNYVPTHILIQNQTLVTTSSYANTFPDGLLIGRLVNVNKTSGTFFDLTVELSTNFSALNDVYITHHQTRGELEEMEKQFLPKD